jgi:hypothetical protein
MKSRLVRIAIAAAVGLAAPYVEVARLCRAPDPVTLAPTEACVWSRAYLPLSRPLYFVAYGLFTYAVLSVIFMAARRLRRPA